MPKYPKPPKSQKFNGTTSIVSDIGYVFNKIKFEVSGADLYATFYNGQKKGQRIVFRRFKTKTALQAIGDTDLGRHFESGIYDIWHYFDLPFGYLSPITREYNSFSVGKKK